MKHLSSTSWLLSTIVLLCGCGSGGIKPPSVPPADGAILAGNWQFSTTSTTSGMPPLTIAGSMNQSGTTVSATMHVNGSNCFDPLTTVRLTGTLTGGNISLTSTSVTGESIAFTGSIVNPVTFTGTYAIDGGCANGDRGSVTGSNIPSIASQMTGSFTTSGGDTFDMAGTVDQESDGSSDGTFALKGTLSFTTSCFSSGTITSGRFPSGSFIMGTSVALEIATGNGKITFLGTADEGNGSIIGNYTLSGGTCDQTGTGMLVFSDPWGY